MVTKEINTENTEKNTDIKTENRGKSLIPYKSGENWKGNANGRPKGSRNLTKIFELAMHEVKERAKQKGTVIEDPEIEIVLSLLAKAQKGDTKALELYMKYKYGNPTQPLDITGDIKTEGIKDALAFFNTLITKK